MTPQKISVVNNENNQGYLVNTVEKLAAQCINGGVSNAVEVIKNMRACEAAYITLHLHSALLRSEAYLQASELASVRNWQYH